MSSIPNPPTPAVTEAMVELGKAIAYLVIEVPESVHDELMRRYQALEAALSAAPAPDAEDAARWRAILPHLQFDEPEDDNNAVRMGCFLRRNFAVPVTNAVEFADALRSEGGRRE